MFSTEFQLFYTNPKRFVDAINVKGHFEIKSKMVADIIDVKGPVEHFMVVQYSISKVKVLRKTVYITCSVGNRYV